MDVKLIKLRGLMRDRPIVTRAEDCLVISVRKARAVLSK